MVNNDKIKFRLNLLLGFISSAFSALQSFWFIPYVKDYLGTTAYGYISVISGLVNTLFVLSSAVGAMGTRFILVTLENNRKSEANEYFNSEFFALLLFSIILLIISIFFSFHLKLIMRIDNSLYKDVQILFIMTVSSFILQLIMSPFSASFFYKNTIFITYIIFILDYMGRVSLTIFMYNHGNRVLWSSSLATDIIYVLGLSYYVRYCQKNIPDLKINFTKFKITKTIELVKSGWWIAMSSAGNMLLSSLNTYFANILCGVFITGIYASIMQFNIVESMLLTVLVNSLLPKMFKMFSGNESNNLFYYTVYSMGITAMFLSIISGGIIVYGTVFMKIWMGNHFGNYPFLILLSVIYLPFTLPSQVLNQSFTVMNKVMIPALLTVFSGIINVVLAIILTKLLKLGIYGIALASLLVQVIRDCVMYPYYFFKVSEFFNFKIMIPFMEAFAGTIIVVVVCLLSKLIIMPDSLIHFVLSILLGGSISLIIIAPLTKFFLGNLLPQDSNKS